MGTWQIDTPYAGYAGTMPDHELADLVIMVTEQFRQNGGAWLYIGSDQLELAYRWVPASSSIKVAFDDDPPTGLTASLHLIKP